MLAPWICSNLPDAHRIYVEPFGGAASVLLKKQRSYAEVYNDLDQDVVNFFQVLRSDRASELQNMLRLTPFARAEFEIAYQEVKDPVERARRLVVRSFMGFGANAHNVDSYSGFRASSNRSGSTPAHDWANYPDALPALIDRLKGVLIESRDAFELISKNDSPDTLFYVDPPYLKSTRGSPRHGYAFEMSDDDHCRLAALLQEVQGMVVLSGYPSELYTWLYPSWKRVEQTTFADGAGERTECLWLNPAASDQLAVEKVAAAAKRREDEGMFHFIDG